MSLEQILQSDRIAEHIKAQDALIEKLLAALDTATDLLPVAEWAQDEEWYRRQQEVFDAFQSPEVAAWKAGRK